MSKNIEQSKKRDSKQKKKSAKKNNEPRKMPAGTSFEAEQTFLLAVGEKIRTIRESKNLTIREFADVAGMDNSKLAKFEKGRVNYTILTLRRISEALGVPAQQLLDV